mgnify:CR=1 FL=1
MIFFLLENFNHNSITHLHMNSLETCDFHNMMMDITLDTKEMSMKMLVNDNLMSLSN